MFCRCDQNGGLENGANDGSDSDVEEVIPAPPPHVVICDSDSELVNVDIDETLREPLKDETNSSSSLIEPIEVSDNFLLSDCDSN